MTIGERIKQLRTQNDMSVADLAYFLGGRTSYSQLCRWERGDIEPMVRTINEVCKVFRISLSEFFDGVEI